MPAYPDIQQGQVIQDPGIGGAFASAFAGVAQAMKERQKLDMEQKELNAKLEYYKVNTEGSKLDNAKKKQDAITEQKRITAHQTGNDAYSKWLIGGAKKEEIGKVSAELTDPEASQYFHERVLGNLKEADDAATAALHQSQATVNSSTVTQQIARVASDTSTAASDAVIKGAEAEVAGPKARADLKLTQAQTAAQLANARESDARAAYMAQGKQSETDAKATALWKTTGMTAKDAWGHFGAKQPDGMAPDQKYEVQTRGMAIYKATSKSAAASAAAAQASVESLTAQGVTIGRMTPFKKWVPGHMLYGTIPEPEQALIESGGQFASQYLLAISGKAATDSERAQAMDQMIPRSGDGQMVREQKQIMREMMVQVMFDASQGATRPISQIMKSVIDVARSRGVSGDGLQFLIKGQMDAVKAEKLYAVPGPGDLEPPVSAGMDTTQTTADSTNALLQGYGR